MKNLTLPFKGMRETNISQTYHSGHEALDLVNSYASPMCALENSRVELIFGDTYTPGNHTNTKRGYGVWLTGLETGLVYVIWHSLPILPVNGGDIVKRGQIVAYMGNSGLVRSGGKYVPLEERDKPPYRGTHLHLQIFKPGSRIGDWRGETVNPLDRLNWNWHPQYSIADQLFAISKTIKKATKLVVNKL